MTLKIFREILFSSNSDKWAYQLVNSCKLFTVATINQIFSIQLIVVSLAFKIEFFKKVQLIVLFVGLIDHQLQ